MTWQGILTGTALIAILRPLLNESTSAFPDTSLLAAINAAILSVRGELFIPSASAAITMTTGTYKYDVGAGFVAIEHIRDSAGEILPDYAWELSIGADAEIYFNAPYFTPTTGSNPTVFGWKVQPVIAAAEYIGIDPGYVMYRALADSHAALGGSGADKAAWHQSEHTRYTALAEARYKDEIALAKYRPSVTARLVPGRIGG